jgi:hypothetical protein
MKFKSLGQNCLIDSRALIIGPEKIFLVTATKKHLPHGGNMFVGDSRA